MANGEIFEKADTMCEDDIFEKIKQTVQGVFPYCNLDYHIDGDWNRTITIKFIYKNEWEIKRAIIPGKLRENDIFIIASMLIGYITDVVYKVEKGEREILC